MERFYRILGINKSEIADVALEELFEIGQEEVMREIMEKGLTGRRSILSSGLI
jgi:hypothetical protein